MYIDTNSAGKVGLCELVFRLPSCKFPHVLLSKDLMLKPWYSIGGFE